MKHLFTLLTMACVFEGGIQLHAQNAIPASGGEASGAGGTSSYTIGQIVYTAESASDGAITHGVQQPFEISIVTGIEDASVINLECIVYPNPMVDFLTLKIGDYDKNHLSYHLFDINGKHSQIHKVKAGETQIEMGDLASGIYFLKILDYKEEVKTFKIIKN